MKIFKFRTLYLLLHFCAWQGFPLASYSVDLPTHLVLAVVEDSLQREKLISSAIIKEAYSRLGINIEIKKYAGNIALKKSNSGEVDGELHRIDGTSRKYINLVQIPIPINYFSIVAYSKRPNLEIKNWQELHLYEIGAVRGIIASDEGTKNMEVRKVDTYFELMQLLMEDKIDLAVTSKIDEEFYISRDLINEEIYLNGVLETYLLYHYLHKKHENITKALTPILKNMLLSGDIARIINSHSQ